MQNMKNRLLRKIYRSDPVVFEKLMRFYYKVTNRRNNPKPGDLISHKINDTLYQIGDVVSVTHERLPHDRTVYYKLKIISWEFGEKNVDVDRTVSGRFTDTIVIITRQGIDI
jgi:hypothetical protein